MTSQKKARRRPSRVVDAAKRARSLRVQRARWRVWRQRPGETTVALGRRTDTEPPDWEGTADDGSDDYVDLYVKHGTCACCGKRGGIVMSNIEGQGLIHEEKIYRDDDGQPKRVRIQHSLVQDPETRKPLHCFWSQWAIPLSPEEAAQYAE